MKFPTDAVIAPAKLNQYLLVPQKRNDKAHWLLTAGYSVENWALLERDIREQILPLDAVLIEETPYGTMVEIAGELTGPNGKVLAVRSFWMFAAAAGEVRFVTLYPDKGKRAS